MSGLPPRERGWSPFRIFGVGLVVAAGWGTYMGLAYAADPGFLGSALPTIAGTSAAVVAVLLIGLRAPANE